MTRRTLMVLAAVVAVGCGPTAEQLNTEDPEGFTALIRSAGKGDVSSARKQINRGARIDLTTKKDDLTALSVASYCGHLPMVQLLVEKGAAVTDHDVEYAANGGQKAILAYYKTAHHKEPPTQTLVSAFVSVGSMPLDALKAVCAK